MAHELEALQRNIIEVLTPEELAMLRELDEAERRAALREVGNAIRAIAEAKRRGA